PEPTAAPPTPAATATPSTVTPEQIAANLRAATVRVTATFGETAVAPEGLGAGSGVVYDVKNGYIITNAHVVEGASSIKVAEAQSNEYRPARVVGRAQCDDLAVLQVDDPRGLVQAPLGESDGLQVGAEVTALGYPLSFQLGNDLSVNVGRISQLDAELGKYRELIKHDADINPGNSGGPLVSNKGEVVGINTLGFGDSGAQGQNFAIAMSLARPIIADLQAAKNRQYIGLNLVPNEYAEYFGTDQGMAIAGVVSGSPAARTGIQQADLLLKMEGQATNSEVTVCDILRSHAAGEQVKVTVYRKATDQMLEGEMTIGRVGAYRAPQLTVVSQGNGGDGGDGGDGGNNGGDSTVLVNTNFDNGRPGPWSIDTGDGFAVSVAGGDYVLAITKPSSSVYSFPTAHREVPNGAVSTSVRMQGNGFAGVAARIVDKAGSEPSDLYVCWIDSQKQFGCAKTVNSKVTVLVQPKALASIKPTGANVIVLAASGTQILFKVNDVEVARFEDDELPTGAFGVYAESTPGDFKALFDELAIVRAN
ncbi:MAG: trypsin-like peptidase domain-containing protein, partial [Chloroflexia bacterium]